MIMSLAPLLVVMCGHCFGCVLDLCKYALRAIGWSGICDCVITWSYSLVLKESQYTYM